ncbi:MAG: VOC family protein [Patescibacteria group bacterium]
MNKILGIGGLFFRANDPAALKSWYVDVLGIVIKEYVWQQEAGPTVLEPFAMDSDYFPLDKSWMINFRVSDLEAVIADLKGKGVNVEVRDEWNASPEMGKFARVQDPEGNPVELWQPA